ncbi:molybdopterin-guanine dinucleotide biosynthesis protein B [Alteribacillus sp. YIM 98480]|uniref:molybdopterin-guanine dinucleotide biosynthesis protein B n=1 Tax=Alteribacillus sp. YIM 98480 TaxID=2606599 RepID=UPI001E54A37C|nr:molybdopterin-guanine dinucleotide biosynthesis protein B [Alteribacillus sp. YIM 98480]
MGQYCPVLQIIGYENSGKTTLMEKLIKKSSCRGLQAASVKHHGHGGEPATEKNDKDSSRHQQAGAFLSSVEGSGMLHLQASTHQWGLEEIIELYYHFHPDIIFVEGYKNAAYPKVVLLRNQEDEHLLDQCTNVICAISHYKNTGEQKRLPVPHFFLQDDVEYIDYIFQKVRKQDE